VKALALKPLQADSAALLDVPEPEGGSVLVQTLAVGVCGTDREILGGEYGWAPPGREHLVLGHESLGEVLEANAHGALRKGDLVVGIVRQPDPVPCPACAAGEWDMCRNGRYTEHGIKELDGFCRERFRAEPDSLVRIDTRLRDTGVLLEPASVVAKAWDHIERIGQRTRSWQAGRVLVTGAGPIGLLAALLARQRGCELHVYDRNTGGAKQRLVGQLGGTYHSEGLEKLAALQPDIVIECTGAAPVIATVMCKNAASAIVCLTGLSSGIHRIRQDLNELNRTMVLENDVVFGTVNANRRHYEAAAAALGDADRDWLRALITRRVPLDRWQEAFERKPGDVKVVVELS
jgi:threonine dehydrogenase-like Zn-dependent dehydrogenase